MFQTVHSHGCGRCAGPGGDILIEDIEILEREFIAKTAAKYRSRGYEVEETVSWTFCLASAPILLRAKMAM